MSWSSSAPIHYSSLASLSFCSPSLLSIFLPSLPLLFLPFFSLLFLHLLLLLLPPPLSSSSSPLLLQDGFVQECLPRLSPGCLGPVWWWWEQWEWQTWSVTCHSHSTSCRGHQYRAYLLMQTVSSVHLTLFLVMLCISKYVERGDKQSLVLKEWLVFVSVLGLLCWSWFLLPIPNSCLTKNIRLWIVLWHNNVEGGWERQVMITWQSGWISVEQMCWLASGMELLHCLHADCSWFVWTKSEPSWAMPTILACWLGLRFYQSAFNSYLTWEGLIWRLIHVCPSQPNISHIQTVHLYCSFNQFRASPALVKQLAALLLINCPIAPDRGE